MGDPGHQVTWVSILFQCKRSLHTIRFQSEKVRFEVQKESLNIQWIEWDRIRISVIWSTNACSHCFALTVVYVTYERPHRTYLHPQAPQKHMNAQHRKARNPCQSHASSVCLARCLWKQTSADTRLSHALRSNRAQFPWCPFWGFIIRHSILVLSFCFYNNAHGLERKSCECGQESAPSIQRVHGGGAGPTLARITYAWVGGAMHANTSTLFSKASFLWSNYLKDFLNQVNIK